MEETIGKRLVRLREAQHWTAARLGCTTSHVRDLARAGRLQQRRISDRLYLYDPADVERLAAEKVGRERLPKVPRR